MAVNGAGIVESIVHSPISGQAAYSYRSKMGMIPSAEWCVFFDDFVSSVATNVPDGWAGAVIDAGATAVTDTTAAVGATGVLLLSDATASEGVAIYGPKAIQLTSDKRFFMECRVRTDDVTDNAIQFGLSSLTATTNPEDLWTTTATDLVAFGLLDGSAYPQMLSDKANSGTTVQTQTTRIMTVNTWHVLAIEYNGAGLRGYVDGKLALTWSSASTTIPTGVALAPFFAALNGNGAGANNTYFDYVRYALER
jgi:hypothetical protein